MNEDIRAILQAALQAPSGENAQPWRFRISDSLVGLFNEDSSDQSLYNYNNYGSFVAHGAAIENMVTAAAHLGYETTVSLFPDSENSQHVANVQLNKAISPNAQAAGLYEAIFNRVTNRKPFKRDPLDKETLDQLTEGNSLFTNETSFITDRVSIEKLARVGSANEEIMLQNRELHNFFFSHLTWTKEEDEKKKVGFYIETLELPPPAKLMFRVFQHWNVMKVLKILNFPALVGKANAATYSAAGAHGIISISEITREQFVNAGRTFQHIWLTATKNSLYIQPMTGVIFMNFLVDAGHGEHFSKRELMILRNKIETLKKLNPSNMTPAILFRLGFADTPSAQAVRFPIDELMIT
jgi:hypothetical protein